MTIWRVVAFFEPESDFVRGAGWLEVEMGARGKSLKCRVRYLRIFTVQKTLSGIPEKTNNSTTASLLADKRIETVVNFQRYKIC